jgi:hypothetical protein
MLAPSNEGDGDEAQGMGDAAQGDGDAAQGDGNAAKGGGYASKYEDHLCWFLAQMTEFIGEFDLL